MKRVQTTIAAALTLLAFGCATTQNDSDAIYQTSTINALLDAVYDGETTFAEMAKHGGFGIGTFDKLDGEMIALDGDFYQIKIDGIAYPVCDKMKTPFAVTTFFEPDQKATLNDIENLDDLQKRLDALINSANLFQAIRIDGTFDYIKTRSVPAQKEPYAPLAEVAKKQAVFEFNNAKGSIVGFRCPDFVAGVNVPGYHFHFINEERNAGGHLLECNWASAKAAIDASSRFTMQLPEKGKFHSKDLGRDMSEDLQKVER